MWLHRSHTQEVSPAQQGHEIMPAVKWGCQRPWVSRRASKCLYLAGSRRNSKDRGLVVLGKVCERQSMGIFIHRPAFRAESPSSHVGDLSPWASPFITVGWGEHRFWLGETVTPMWFPFSLKIWISLLSQLKWLFSIYFKDQDFENSTLLGQTKH